MNEEKFNQMVTDVALIKDRLDTLINTQTGRTEDHETRIRVLEDFRSKTIGIVAASSVFGGIIGAIVQFLITKI
jgi:hypothetical protein